MPTPMHGFLTSLSNTHARTAFRIRAIISRQPPLFTLGIPQTLDFNHFQTCSVGLYSGEYVGRANRRKSFRPATNFLIYLQLWMLALSSMITSIGLRL